MAKKDSIISFNYQALPLSHSYVQLKINFYFLSDLWQEGSVIFTILILRLHGVKLMGNMSGCIKSRLK